jgi:salicylate hydroxylase
VNLGVTVESVETALETPSETGTPIAAPASRTLRPAVRLKTGEILHADIIIGADGPRSVVHPVVLVDEEQEVTPIGFGLYSGTSSIPMTTNRKHAPLKQLLDVGWPMMPPIWVGDTRRAALGTSSTLNLGYSSSIC